MRDEHRKARLRYLIKTDYGTQVKFTQLTPFSESRTSQAAGKKEPFAEDAAAIWEEKLGLPTGWFNNTWPTPKEAAELGVKMTEGYPEESTRLDRGDFVAVRRADVTFSNGTGHVVEHEDDKPPLVFRADFLRRLGIAPGNAVVVDADGHSNEPKIAEGSVVLVNKGDRDRLDNSFFAFRYDGELLIKRLERIEGVGVLATAENSNFKPKSRVYKETEEGAFEVIGKAVWIGAML